MLGNHMQNISFRNKLMVRIYTPPRFHTERCWSVLVQLETSEADRADSNEHINKIPEVRHLSPPLPSCPPDQSKPPKMLASGPIYGGDMAPTGSGPHC